MRATKFVPIDSLLYKRSFSMSYLRCLTPTETEYAMRKVHKRICGNHLGARALAHKLVRSRYFWSSMKAKIVVVRKCDKCQRFTNTPQVLVIEPKHLSSPWSFAQQRLDILGLFLLSLGQRTFLLVGIHYFKKWVKAKLLAIISKQKVWDFLWKNIICRFGLPKVIVNDNGRQFDGKKFRYMCEQLGIKLKTTLVAHSQTNR